MSKELKIDLTPTAKDSDLFSTQKQRDEARQEKVEYIPRELIDPFPNHPFKVRMDDKMQELSESIKNYGVLVPCIIREKKNGRFEMVAGHRRNLGSEYAGLMEIPCINKNLTDDEAIIIMVDSNLQREEILPSEKAFAYKMKLQALSNQGKRNDLTLSHIGTKLRSSDTITEETGDTKSTIHRYIRLTELTPKLLELVDDGKIAPTTTGYYLSFLSKENQKSLQLQIEIDESTPSMHQAKQMKSLEEQGVLDEDKILSIMSEQKPNQVEQFKMPKAKIEKYFTEGTTAEKMESIIIKALDLYIKNKNHMRDQGKSSHDRER